MYILPSNIINRTWTGLYSLVSASLIKYTVNLFGISQLIKDEVEGEGVSYRQGRNVKYLNELLLWFHSHMFCSLPVSVATCATCATCATWRTWLSSPFTVLLLLKSESVAVHYEVIMYSVWKHSHTRTYRWNKMIITVQEKNLFSVLIR
jgi:hypothetical protein